MRVASAFLTLCMLSAPLAVAADAPARFDQPARGDQTYAPIVKTVGPGVVTVFSSRTLAAGEGAMAPDHPLFRDFFGPGGPGAQPPLRQQGLGSGVIVSADGYILTNHHVIDQADEIRVKLANNYDEFTARLVGSDAKSDIAVLKIEPGSTKLMPVPFADTSKVEVGDVVLAIGNPMGVGQTVTMGIISATGRGVGILDYEDFLQTDAAINVGNSGGALVDTSGRLVGINTAILSRTGGSVGIGFAVPANFARSVMDQIISTGKVVRGYIGVMIQPVTPDIAKAMNLESRGGALVGDVVPDGPAAKAGLKAGDLITAINGEPVADPRQLRLRIASTRPGSTLPLTVRRGDEQLTVQLTVADLAESAVAQGAPGSPEGQRLPRAIGVRLQDVNEDLRAQLSLPERLRGALVAEVEPGSRAAKAGLRPGDLVHEVGGKEVRSAEDAAKAIRGQTDKPLLLRVWSGGGSRYVVIPEK